MGFDVTFFEFAENKKPKKPKADPVIAQALKILGQQVNPVEVVGPDDYERINMPPELRDQATQKIGFRLNRGGQADPSIYINRTNPLYAAAGSGNKLAQTIMAGTLAHEHTHNTESGEIGEGAARRIEADWLRTQTQNFKGKELEALLQYIQKADQIANAILKRK